MTSLRVLVVGPDGIDHQAENIAAGLRRMGHDVMLSGPPRRLVGPHRVRNAEAVLAAYACRLDEVLQRHLVAATRRHRPDLVVSADVSLRPAIVSAMRAAGAGRLVLVYPDAVANLGNHQAFVAGYDRIYLKIGPVVDQLRTVQGLPVRYLPQAANPERHRPVVDYGTEPVIVMAGNVHPTRAVLLERLLDDGVPLRLHGPPISTWLDVPRLRALHSGTSVRGLEKARTFRSARGVLNNLHPAELAGANCRLFEAAGCGAVVLTEWRSGMADLYEPGTEVLIFETYGELLAHCRHLLADVGHGRGIADAAARRTAAEHTWEHRLTTLLADLGLP